MDPATLGALQQQQLMQHQQLGLALADPGVLMQHQRLSYDAMQDELAHAHLFGHVGANGLANNSGLLGRKHNPDRRPLRFWQPFNDWWRSELERLGRRPTSHEIGEWYESSADSVWADNKPTLQETRVHAKCLRSLPLVRDYFRNYRAKKKAKDGSGYLDGEGGEDGDTGDAHTATEHAFVKEGAETTSGATPMGLNNDQNGSKVADNAAAGSVPVDPAAAAAMPVGEQGQQQQEHGLTSLPGPGVSCQTAEDPSAAAVAAPESALPLNRSQGAQCEGTAARPADADEVLLLGKADMEGMTPQLLKAHICLVQEELVTKSRVHLIAVSAMFLSAINLTSQLGL
eukprot:gene10131-10289_t